MFTLLDFRERNNPTVVESKEHSKLLSSLYSVLFWQYQIQPIQIESVIQTPFGKFIYQILNQPNDSQNIQNFVSSCGKQLSNEKLHPFLRRVLFFQYFVLNNIQPLNSSVFEWVNELSFETLCQRFHIQFPGDFNLPGFPIISLPTNIVDFYLPPFQLNISDQEYQRFVCLLDGCFVKSNENDSINIPFIFSFIENIYSNYNFPIPFLVLSGSYFSKILFYNQTNFICEYESFYLDNIGIPDVGLHRRRFLKFSPQKFESFIEFMLNHNWEI